MARSHFDNQLLGNRAVKGSPVILRDYALQCYKAPLKGTSASYLSVCTVVLQEYYIIII